MIRRPKKVDETPLPQAAQVALPDDDCRPLLRRGGVARASFAVGGDPGRPIIAPGKPAEPAIMSASETNVNEDRLAARRERDAGVALQIAPAGPVPTAERRPADRQFGTDAFLPDASHDSTAAFGGCMVDHGKAQRSREKGPTAAKSHLVTGSLA